jgi:putative PIN family toxin of toxin-antitoxin system
MRVVLDTNVVVSAVMSARGAPNAIMRAWANDEFQLLVNESIVAEYADVLTRPDIIRYIRLTATEIDHLLVALRACEHVSEHDPVTGAVTADLDDEPFLTCAVHGNADVLVSGDVHLTALKAYRGIPIVTPAAFQIMRAVQLP